MGRGCGQLRYQLVEFLDIGMGDGSSALRIAVGDADRDDSALAVFGDGSVLGEFSPRLPPIEFRRRDADGTDGSNRSCTVLLLRMPR